MQSLDPIEVREAQIAKIVESKKELAALLRHLKEIVEGPAFKGSHRSAQFLKYIVEQSVAGNFDLLKERMIGVELFGRDPSYDTGEDAIVRVTASDVRKRLLQHYGKSRATCEFRLTLPSGSYIPEIVLDRHSDAGSPDATASHQQADIAEPDAILDRAVAPASPEQQASYLFPPPIPHSDTTPVPSPRKRQWLLVGLALLTLLNITFWGLSWNRSSRAVTVPNSILPWSAFFSSSHITRLITSDPNIVVVQEITGSHITVSDYANHEYIPKSNQLTSEEIRLCHTILWGDDSAAAIDPPITARIAALASASAKKIDVSAARGIQLSDLKSDDNFIFLGSPRSDPWSALFNDKLDFRFLFDNATKQEIIRNVHPRKGELPAYIPTALGWGTGQSFAIVAFVQNLDQNGQVLLLAGANGEGTEAAGRLVTDPSRLATALQRCGIRSGNPLRHFEILLRLSTMAGSPTTVDVVACHALPSTG
ncbi:MAG TPA: hypothetical protein VND66_09000 [Acidobacteriaceae bacterium]|nr:hypothetical protein [Acidobacteriaceae bacterium]